MRPASRFPPFASGCEDDFLASGVVGGWLVLLRPAHQLVQLGRRLRLHPRAFRGASPWDFDEVLVVHLAAVQQARQAHVRHAQVWHAEAQPVVASLELGVALVPRHQADAAHVEHAVADRQADRVALEQHVRTQQEQPRAREVLRPEHHQPATITDELGCPGLVQPERSHHSDDDDVRGDAVLGRLPEERGDGLVRVLLRLLDGRQLDARALELHEEPAQDDDVEAVLHGAAREVRHPPGPLAQRVLHLAQLLPIHIFPPFYRANAAVAIAMVYGIAHKNI